MHYLILTPDGVGSTILQRLLTMTLHIEQNDVINTHELTNGLSIKNNIAVKNYDLKYSQSLEEIENILLQSQEQTILVSRLAKYHLDNRKDNANDCDNFYRFLNTYFKKKIMCVRENIFEYAMSWSIRKKSGILNVYNKKDRDRVSQVSEVDENYFISKCQQYVKYIDWVEQNFPNVEKVSYEALVKDSDTLMQELTGYKNTFTNRIGISLSNILYNEYVFLRNKEKSGLSSNEMKALAEYRILSNEMIKKNIIFNIPFKNTTLLEKKNQVKNFDSCLDKFYNFAKNHNWIDQSKATYDYWNQKHIC